MTVDDFKAIRERLSLSQMQMAFRGDLSLSTVQAFEAGRLSKDCHPRTRVKLATAYGVEPANVLEALSNPQPSAA